MDAKGQSPQKQAGPARGQQNDQRKPKDDRRPGRSGEGVDSVLPHVKVWERSRARARALKDGGPAS
jgi:hypothetical protein